MLGSLSRVKFNNIKTASNLIKCYTLSPGSPTLTKQSTIKLQSHHVATKTKNHHPKSPSHLPKLFK